MVMMTELKSVDLAPLRSRLIGEMLEPGESGFEATVQGFNLAVRRTPVAVVEVASAQDVATVVRFADSVGLGVAVQATGHGGSPIEREFIQVNTSRLDECAVQAGSSYGWARIGAGVRWSQVIEAAADRGMAPLAGSAPNVGVVGYLTGGGYGPIARSHGLASDLVRAFEMVTGDGRVRRVTAAEEPELFWGVRGGKGALGIVTAVEIDLLPITELYAGSVCYDGSDTSAVLRAWRDWSNTLPAQATTSIALQRLPELPGVPAELAARLTVAVRFAWVGDPVEGARVFAPMREAAPIIFGEVGTMSYSELGSIHQDPEQPMPMMERNALFGEGLSDAALDSIAAWAGPSSNAPHPLVELRQLGGVVGLTEVASSAGHRRATHSLFIASIDAPGIGEQSRAHADEMLGALEPWTTGGILPNFQTLHTAEDARRAYEPNTLMRLAALVWRFDPREVMIDGSRITAAAHGG